MPAGGTVGSTAGAVPCASRGHRAAALLRGYERHYDTHRPHRALGQGGVDDSLTDRTARSVAESGQRIARSRAYLAHGHNQTKTATITNNPNSNAPNG